MAEYVFNSHPDMKEFCLLLDDDEDKRSTSTTSTSTSTASTAATFKSEIIIEINNAIKAVPKEVQKPLQLMSDAIDALRTNQKTIFERLGQHKSVIEKTDKRMKNAFGNDREHDLSTSLELLCAKYLKKIFKNCEFILKYPFNKVDGGKDEIDIFGEVQESETKYIIELCNISEKYIKLYIFAHRLGDENRKEVIEKVNKHGIILILSHELFDEKNLGSQENEKKRFCCCQ